MASSLLIIIVYSQIQSMNIVAAEGPPDGLTTSFALSLGKQLKEILATHSPVGRGIQGSLLKMRR